MPQSTPAAGAITSALETYNFNALQDMAQALGQSGDVKARKAALAARLAGMLGSEAHLRLVRPQLSRRQWHALATPRLRHEPVSLRALHMRLRALGADDRLAIADLAHMFRVGCLLFLGSRGQQLFDFKAETLAGPWARHSLVSSFPAILDEADVQAPVPAAEAGPEPDGIRPADFADLQRDLFVGLRLAAEGGVKLTVAGLPYRTSINRLAGGGGRGAKARKNRTGTGSVAAAEPGIRPWFVLALLADPALTEQGDSMEPTGEAQRLLALPMAGQAERLFRAWLSSPFDEFNRITTLQRNYGDPSSAWVDRSEGIPYGDLPDYDRLRRARRSIVATIKRARAGAAGWMGLANLGRAVWSDDPEFLVPFQASYASSYWYHNHQMGSHEEPYEGFRRAGKNYRAGLLMREKDWPEVEGAFVAQVVMEPLHWLGLVDLGLDAAGQVISFRLTPLGCHVLLGEPFDSQAASGAGPALVVQPNFEVVVLDANANLALLAQLDTFAQRRTLDRAAVYQINREALLRGLDRGITGAMVVDTLEKAARTPLPQNVRYSIDEWVHLYERIHLRRSAVLLEANSAAQMERWQRDAALEAHLAHRIGERMALVLAADLPEVLGHLKRLGEAARHFDYSRPGHNALILAEPAEIEVPIRYDEPYIRYRLGRFATLVGQDGKGLHFRLTPETVRRATDNGTDGAEILRYLAERGDGSLPADIVVRVRGWSGGFPSFRYQRAVAVEAPPGVTWDDLDGVREIRTLLLREINDDVALVATENIERLRAALAERGIRLEPGLTDQSAGILVAHPVKPEAKDVRYALHVARADAPLWRRIMRETAVEIERLTTSQLHYFLKDAIQLHEPVALALKTQDKEDLFTVLTPQRILDNDGRLAVEGVCFACREAHCLHLDAVKGVVLLPGSGV